jgi:hypothetical protein
MNGSVEIIHLNAPEGKNAYLLFAAKFDEPSTREVKVK